MSEWRNLPGITYVAISDLTLERTIGLIWRTEHDNDSIKAFCKFAASHDWE